MKRVVRWNIKEYGEIAYYVRKNVWTHDKGEATRLPLLKAVIILLRNRRHCYYGDTYALMEVQE